MMAACKTRTMADADVTSRRSLRSRAKLADEHLCHLAALADAGHEAFTRRDGHPEYRSRRPTAALLGGQTREMSSAGSAVAFRDATLSDVLAVVDLVRRNAPEVVSAAAEPSGGA